MMKHERDTIRKRQRRRRNVEKDKNKKYIQPLSNYDILNLVVELEIPHFYGVFMRDTLLKKARPAALECWILNHDSSDSDGTHWTALAKYKDVAYYFDSFGKLPPPLEVINYLGDSVRLYYNAKRYQNFDTTICGHLCLKFLYDFWRKNDSKNSRKTK